MMLMIELFIYCLLFTVLVRLSVLGGAINGLYFYPKPVQERAIAIGLTDYKTVNMKRWRFMIPFILIMLFTLLIMIGLINHVHDFKTAYWQSLLFLEVMNWYDGVIIDKLWVGHSDFWILKGTEDLPFVQTWPQVLKKRGLLTLIWIVGALVCAGLIVFLF